MTTILDQWAADWGVHNAMVADLRIRLNPGMSLPHETAFSEAAVQQQVRLEAAEKGILIWRNNVGAMEDENGRWIRFGICNDSKAMNERFKSCDLIGLRPNGQFVAREIKHAGWKWSGTEREVAQQNFIDLVIARGGDAAFATGRGTL